VTSPASERRQRVLEERARAVAGARHAPREEGDRVLVFRVGGERFAVELGAVSLVLEASAIGGLVGAPPWLLGAALARSRLVPVLDLRQLLGLQGGGLSDLTRIVVVEHGGEEFGLAAEVLEGERSVQRDEVSPASSGPFRGVTADRTALLDLARLAPREEA
jgi:purine-binding chemotaxis protein CheW